jgi:hypothetical protein
MSRRILSFVSGVVETGVSRFSRFATWTFAGSLLSLALPAFIGIAFCTTANAAPGPVITVPPVSQSVNLGSTATFSVAATGTPTLTYAWQYLNGSGVWKPWAVGTGYDTPTFTTLATTAAYNGRQIRVVVTDGNSLSTTSDPVTLTVNLPPVINTQPVSQSVNLGSTATFSVTATGTPTLTYAWQYLKIGSVSWKSWAVGTGYNTPTFTTLATNAAYNGIQFRVVVTDGNGLSTASNPVTLTVNLPPVINTQPVSQSVNFDNTATFSVTASGTPTLTYVWQYLKIGSFTWKPWAVGTGWTTPTFTTLPTNANYNGLQIRVVVTDGNNLSTISNPVALTVKLPPVITIPPVSQSVILGSSATFSVAATGTPTLTYAWQYLKPGSLTWKSWAVGTGYNTPTFTTMPTNAAYNGLQFRVVVTDGNGLSTTSDPVNLTVNSAPIPITISPSSINFGNVAVGSSAEQTVTVTNNQVVSLSFTSMIPTGPFTTINTPIGTTLPCTGGVLIPSGASCTFQILFQPTGVGATSGGQLVISDTASNSPQVMSLSGTGTGVAPVTISPTSLDFGGVVVGTSGTFQSVRVTNNQTVNLAFTSIVTTGPFVKGSSCNVSIQLAPGDSCLIMVNFQPTAVGAATGGQLVISHTASNSPQIVTLTGTGIAPVTVSPTSLDFGSVVVGATSTWQSVRVTNNQAVNLAFTSIIATAPFVKGSSCNVSIQLAPGDSCIIMVNFQPTALGATTGGQIVISDTASGSPQIVPLSGTGITLAPVTVSPISQDFGSVAVGTDSATQSITLTNNQSTTLTITYDVPAPPFDVRGTDCLNGNSVPPESSCHLFYVFHPTAVGPISGQLPIAFTASNSPLYVTATGIGITPVTVSPTSLNFGNVAVGATSTSQTVTLTNGQTTAITINSLAVTPGTPYTIGASSTCLNPTVAAGASCTVVLTFTPAALGAAPAASLTITDTAAAGSPQTVTLSGTGVGLVTVLPASLDFGSVAVGSTTGTFQSIKVINNQAVNLAFTSIIPTGPFNTINTPLGAGICTVAVQLAPGDSCLIEVYFQPTALGATTGAQLVISDTASNSPQVVPLSGTGIPPVTISPSSIDFGNLAIGTVSTTQMHLVTVTNNQSGNLSITSMIPTGPFSIISMPPGSGLQCTDGVLVPPGASCIFMVYFQPTTVGATTGGQIAVAFTANNSPLVVTLSGTGVLAAAVSPTSLDFGNVAVNATSAMQTFTLTNNQQVGLNFSSIIPTGPFTVTTTTTTCAVGTPVAPGSSCIIGIVYKPTTVGTTIGGQITISDDATNTPQVVSLAGVGVVPVTLNPPNLDFGSVEITNPTVKNLTLTNNQSILLNMASVTGFPAGFALNSATTCVAGTPVAPGGSCVIAISVTPTAVGPIGGTITVNDDANTTPQSFGVSATGTVKLIPSPLSLSFASQVIGTTSAPQMVTLTNPQSIAEPITGATITGPNASDFAVTTTCPLSPATLPAGTNCPMQVTFTPSGPGTRTATLSIGDPLLIPLTGAGSPPVTVLPGLLTYTSPVGSTSTYQTVTITNVSTTNTIHITNFLLSGDFTQTSTSCGTAYPYALAPGASCFLTISFNPSMGGVRDGQLQVYESDVATSPQVINITGTGTYPLSLSGPTLSFSAQTVGTTSPAKLLILTNNESKSEHFTLNTTGDYTANSNCSTGGIAGHSSCTVFVYFTPSSVTPTTRTGSLTVTDTAPGGPSPTASFTGSAIATNPPAAISVVSPGAGAAGTTISAVITGNGWTHFNASSVITFVDTDDPIHNPSDITVTVPDTSTTTANKINAQLVITANPGVVYGARDISVVTMLPGGGTETALLSMAFIIADPTNAHVITDINPNFGIQGLTMNVDLTATGTNFVDTITYANFGDGITVNSLSVTSTTVAHANITISNTTPVGYRTITLVTGGEFATSSSQAFQIGPNSATLVSISPTLTPVVPTAEPQGWSGVVYLTATGTHFLQSATQVSFTGGILSPEVTVTSPTTAVVNVAVPAGAAIGLQNATVWTGGEIASLNNAFTVIGSTPALLGVAPVSGTQGQTLNVVITGNAFTTFPVGVYTHPATDPVIADFTGEIAVNSITVTSASSATVNITISPNANVGGITAKLTVNDSFSGATIFPFGFSVTASNASITNVTPTCVPQGGQATLSVTGVNTLWVQGTTTAAFYPVPYENISIDKITITDATDALLNVAVSTDTIPGTYGFYMATGGQVVSSTINVCAATPTLTMNPANGLLPSGSAVNSFSVSLTGQFTHFGPTTLPVISGEGVTLQNFHVTGLTSATATVQIIAGTNGTPTATGPRLVTLTTGGEIVTTYFNVTQTPVGIISVTPSHGPPSTTMSVEIIGLNTNFTSSGPNPTQVLFGPQITVVPGSIVVNSPTDLTVSVTTSFIDNFNTVPTPPGWQNIYVNTGAEQVMSGFLIDSPAQPTLVSVCVTDSNPCVSSAQQGATVDVTVTGSLTNWVQGTTEMILGAGVTVSNLTIINPTTATATIAVSPTAPVGGNSVIMFTGSAFAGFEIVSGTGFSVTPGASYIFSVKPNITCDANFIAANYCGTSGGTGAPYIVSQLNTKTLNVVGVGTHWLQGETTFSFGPGVVIDSLTVSSPTTAQVQITVLSTSPVGFAPLTATTDGEVVTLQQAIDIEEGFPALLITSPGGAMQGATLNLQVLARYTNWQQGATSAAFSPAGDITVNSVTVIDSDNLILNITVSPNAYTDSCAPGGHVLTVTTGTVQVIGNEPPSGVAPSYFCVAQGAEEITNVSPKGALQGSSGTVSITGSATNFLPGVSLVSFGDSGITTGTVSVNSPTSLTVPITVSTSSTVGYHTVTVTTLGEVANQVYAFTVVPSVATLNEAIPNQAEQGAPLASQPPLVVRLIGQYSHFNTSSTATFGTGITVQSVAYVSNTEIDATINIDPLSYTGGRLVTVTSPGVPCSDQPSVYDVNANSYVGCTPGSPVGVGSEIVTAYVFSIIPGPAIISQVAPATGNEGQEVVFIITGAFTHWAQNFTQFYIAGGGSDITVNSVIINSPTSATVDISISPTANPGARSVYMVTNGEALTDSGAFVVTGGVPVITYLSPNGYQNNPEVGTFGLLVNIYGLYTNWATGSTTVNFGPGVYVSSFQVDNATHIEAVINIDAMAQLGYRTVQVTTTGLPAGTQILTSNFLVSAPAPPPTPYIWYLSPGSGIPGQTFTMTFYGAYTHWDPGTGPACGQTGTTLTGFNASITVNCFQVLSPTTATANITISPTATASTSDLTLTTYIRGVTEVENANFSVIVADATPTLTVVDPGSGMQGSQNLVVNIMGKYTTFDSTTTFNFGSGISSNGPPTILGPTIATQSISIAQLATLGYRSVVATTPDVTGPSQVVGGGYFYVTPSLALILSVTPNIAKQGDTPQVEVAGQNTHWNGSTVFTFGAGITVTKTQVNGLADATLWLSIPALASEGPTWVTATTLGEVATLNNGFVVQAGTPLLLSASPGSEPQQGAAVFTILSQATQWTVNPPTVSYGDGVVVTTVNVTSDTSLTVNGYIQPTTPVGWRNLSVTSGTQVLGLNNALYISPGPAVINNISPSSAGQGQDVPITIYGTNTNWQTGVTTLTFPNVVINSWSVTNPTTIAADITVNDSAPAGQESVTATTGGEVANGINVFTVIQTQPELLSVVSSSEVQGWNGNVVLTGKFTHFTTTGCSPNCSTADFGTGITVNSVTALSTTSLQANITVQPTTTLGYRNVSITSGGEVVSMTNAFNVTIGPAAIQGPLNPASGAQNQPYTVHVTGSQTHFTSTGPTPTTASFGGGIQVTGITVLDLLHADVAITIPSTTSLGFYDVSLTTGGEVARILGGFTVTSGTPILTAVNPPTGHQGDTSLSVALTGLFTHFNTVPGCSPCSTVNFGSGITASLVASDTTHAVATINIDQAASISSRTVTVTTGIETASITGGFSVLAGVPALLNATPSGQAGTTVNVVINGQFTTFQQGFTSVSFGGGLPAPNFVTVNSISQVTANLTIPANAAVGTSGITVTTNGVPLTLPNSFTVTAGTPVIKQISPNIGNPGQTNLTLTLTGQYTNWTTASTVTIGTPSDGITVVGAAGPGLPGPVVTATTTSVTVNINIASGAPVGPADVTVSATPTVPGGFTVQAVVIPPPSILSISPGMNAGGTPINSSIYVVFSQPMNIATFTNSNITLRLTSNQGQGWITIPISISADATGRVLTITPNSLLAVNSQYYLYLSSGITDATAAHNSINTYGQYFSTVFSANTTAPTVNFFNPPALSTVGTNVPIELEFSTDMNQQTQTGMTVTGPGGTVAGSFLWNSNPYGNSPPGWGPGTVLFFTPTTPLAANTTYTVSWDAPLADTAGNAVTPGSFTFNTGSGADTATNNPSFDIANGLTNVGTNVAPMVFFAKPVNPIYINTSTLLLYNSDGGKYINGTVTVAPNGMSATFTPSVPLLPDTYYRFYQAGGYYDTDGSVMYSNGAYLNGANNYFTTGNGSDLVAPDVASISPANGATAVPLNAQVIVHFNSPLDPDAVSNIITVTPAGGSAISGTATLASDLVTLFFVPSTLLAPATQFTVQLLGYQDVIGNVGTTRSFSFQTMTSIAPINVSTGIDASGNLITSGGTADPHWFVNGTITNAKVVAPGTTDWYSGWLANGPNSSWIAPNPNSSASAVVGNTLSTTFNWSGSTTNICLVGGWGTDDWGSLALNGNILVSGANRTYATLTPINMLIGSYLVAGTNTLTLTWVNTDGANTGYRLQAAIQTCGATLTGGTSLTNQTASLVVTSATPAYNASSVPTNSTITLTFNNPLDPATVNSTTLPVMVGWNSNAEIAGNYVVTGNQVVFTPDTPFPTSAQIWVGACNGPYDLAGDNAAYNGCYTQLTYFNTASTATPVSVPFQVMAFTPANGATNVGLRAPVTATFNRSLNFSSINNNDYALFNGDSQSPWCSGGSYSHSQDGTAISFNCGVLPSSATLTAMLGSGLKDWNGDGLIPYTSQFTTTYYDYNTHASLITQRPGNGSSGVNANLPIVLYFNLPLNASGANSGIQVAQNNVAVPGTVNVQDSGYTLVFTPSVPWTPGALIQWWTTGSLTDTYYNATVTTTSGYFYVAGSTASLTPTAQASSPASYSNPVPRNSIFDVQFNTPLNSATINASNVYIFDSSNGNIHIPVTYSQPQPNEILMVPASTLPANHYLYVYIGTGLQSTTSVPASQTQWYEYTGTTSDSTLPVVTSAVPINGQTGIGVNVTPGVIFNKPIDPISVNSNTFQVANGGTPLAGSYWFNSSNTRVEFVPNAPLPANTILVMTLNGVLDPVNNPVTFSSSFTTSASPDFTAPSVVWTSASNYGNVPTNASMTIQFSESMDASTFTYGSNVYIRDTLLNTYVTGAMSWSMDQSVLYLVPSAPLAAGRQYYFAVNGGTDIAGNQMNGYGEYFYATFAGATTAPTVINFNPLNGATGLGTNAIIEAQFSAPIDPNYISGVTLSNGGSTVQTTPVMSAGNTVLQLVPNAPLSPNTIYVMTIAGVKDPAGNIVGTVSDSFTTGPTYDITPPSVVTIDPPNYATVGTNVTPKIVFNKPLNPITVNTTTFYMYLNDTSQFIPSTVTLSANGMEVTLTPQVPLLPNTEYRFYVSSAQDQDGNSISAGWYYFYTGGGVVSSGPTVTVSPLNTATGIPLNAAVIALVSAPIDPTSWTQNSIQLLNGATPVAGTVNEPNTQELTFTPTNPLSASTTYTVHISGFTDANGNTVVPSITTFTTGGTSSGGGFTYTGANINNNATVTNISQPIILTFSQILDPSTVNSSTLEVMVGWNSNRGIAGTYSVNGNQVTFTPNVPYPSGAQIYVGECGGPTDILGDVFQNGNCWSQQLLYFYVPSYTPGASGAPTSLSVLSVSPANGATNVRHDQSVSVTFSNPINNSTAGGYNMQLYAGQDMLTYGSVTMSSDGRTLTFNTGALSYNGATYTIAIPAGGVTDDWGNSLTALFTSTFTTSVNPATGNGSVQSTNPGNTSGVPTDNLLTLYMNRQVDPSTVPGSLTVTVNGQIYAGNTVAVAGGYEIQFTPTVPFPNSAAVQWFLSGNVMDVNGDYFNSTSGYFYIVAAVNPATAQPTVVAVSPGLSSYNMPVNGEIDIQYSLPIDPTTLNTSNVYFNGSLAETITQPSPNIVRVKLNSAYSPSKWYYLCANSNVKGTNGVATPGGCWTTYFYTSSTTTPDTTPGTVKIGPPDGSANIGTNAFIRLQFSKPVDSTTINSTNVQITTSGNPIDGTWSYNVSSGDVVGANFSPVNPLPPSSLISVSVSGLQDYAGNTFAAASSTFTTAATPDYSSPNVSLDFSYWQSGIATNASFNCRYSEAMDPSSVNSGNTYIHSYVDSGNIPVTYTWSSDLMTVTMTPTTPLFADAQYIYYCNSAIDLTGNGQSNGSAGFYTGNGPLSQGPTLLYANPPNGMTNVPVDTSQGPWYNSSLGLLFNEPVAGDSLGNITLTPLGGSPIPISANTEYGNTIVWIQLPWTLSTNTQYTYNITGVTDLSGNAITPVTSTFTTGAGFDFSQPTVASTSPANGVTTIGIPTTASITFSEAMDPVLINTSNVWLQTHNTHTVVPTTLSFSTDFKTVTLTPTVPLAESTIYDLVIYGGSFYPYDIAGNSLSMSGYIVYNSGYVFSEFTTGTTAAVNGACGTANGGTFSAPPTANLCSTGTASGQSNAGGVFNWSCSGQYGGTATSCAATVTPASACYTQPSGLVSWWKGDDDATDHMGNNNGTLVNGASFALGQVNDAFSFNGSNQYVLIGQPVPADLQLQNNFAHSAWIYITSYPSMLGSTWGTIVGSEYGSNHSGIGLYVGGSVSGSEANVPPGAIDLDIGNGSSWYSVYTTTQVPLNQWVLVTATATANNPVQIYYNGVLQPTMTPSGQTVWNGTVSYNGSGFGIGQTVNENYSFNGLIDEVQVYNTNLTAAQIQGIYNAGNAGVCP